MEDHVREALEIVRAQARVRIMTVDEITSMIAVLAHELRTIINGGAPDEVLASGTDPMSAIKEKSVTCLECGKLFRVVTKRHLASHGLTVAEYKARHGYKKDVTLAAKELARERRKKIKEMKLWEKRRGKKNDQG